MDDFFSNRLQQASDDVLSRIGRNVLIYQRIEKNLKHLDGSGRPITIDTATTAESVVDQLRINHSAVKRSTLGNVVRRLFKIGDSPEHQPTDEQPRNSLTYSFATTFEDTQETRAWADDFYNLVNARNRVAHDFLDAFDLETSEGCEECCRQLDLEYETARSFLYFTRSAGAGRKQISQIAAEFLQSDEFAELFAQTTVLSEFVHTFEAEIQRLSRPDGWCAFTTAEQAVRASQPELTGQLSSAFGSIRAAANASKAFEWLVEPTKRGSRLMFRRRTD